MFSHECCSKFHSDALGSVPMNNFCYVRREQH
jgi:hypothetical protein